MTNGNDTKAKILTAALDMAKEGIDAVTLRGVAARLGINHRTVINHYGTIAALRQATAESAFDRDYRQIIARMIIDKHPLVEQRVLPEHRAAYVALLY